MSVREIDLVLSGSGTLFPCHVGAVARLQADDVRIARVAGTSGGSIVAAGIATEMSAEEMLSLSKKVLCSGDMLDASWFRFFSGYGIHRGDKIHKLLKSVFPGKIGNTSLPFGAYAADLWSRQPVLFASWTYPDLPLADVLRASMSIPLWFRAVEVLPHTSRLFVDGGVSVNFGMETFDDNPIRPTLGVRFRGSTGATKPVNNFIDYAKSLVELFLWSANNSHVSTKRFSSVVTVDTNGDGMDFSLTEDQVTGLFNDGWRAMDDYMVQTWKYEARPIVKVVPK